jgi:hypothetical protein
MSWFPDILDGGIVTPASWQQVKILSSKHDDGAQACKDENTTQEYDSQMPSVM